MNVSVGVMARAPVPGRCKTRLAPALSAVDAAGLYRVMLADKLDAFEHVAAARLVIMAAPEDDGVAALRRLAGPRWDVLPQRGDGLGARLENAFRALAADGSAVALVDSDSPTAPVAPIADAFATLTAPSSALMGPCEDGGYYLIALTSVTSRELGILRDIPWSSGEVAARTRARCLDLGITLGELPVAFDVDTPADLARLRAELREHPGRAPRTAEWLLGR